MLGHSDPLSDWPFSQGESRISSIYHYAPALFDHFLIFWPGSVPIGWFCPQALRLIRSFNQVPTPCPPYSISCQGPFLFVAHFLSMAILLVAHSLSRAISACSSLPRAVLLVVPFLLSTILLVSRSTLPRAISTWQTFIKGQFCLLDLVVSLPVIDQPWFIPICGKTLNWLIPTSPRATSALPTFHQRPHPPLMTSPSWSFSGSYLTLLHI